MTGTVRPQLHLLGHPGFLRRRQTALRPAVALPIDQARQTIGVVAMHPVAQRLPVHAAGTRGIASGRALHDQSQR